MSHSQEPRDDVKLLGVFSTAELAGARIRLAREQPGSRDEPPCFLFDCYVLDETTSNDGYLTEE